MALENSLNKKQQGSDQPKQEKETYSYYEPTKLDVPEEKPKTMRNIVFGVFLLLLTLYWFQSMNVFSSGSTSTPKPTSSSSVGPSSPTNAAALSISPDNPFNRNSKDIVERMGNLMYELGYKEVTMEQLAELRNYNVTATSTAKFHEVGYDKLSLDDLKVLGNAGVTPTFAGMMKELGYTLTVDEMVLLKRNGITANYTSKMMDLGMQNLSVEDLVRLGRYNITTSTLNAYLRKNDGKIPTVDELVRYKISNQ